MVTDDVTSAGNGTDNGTPATNEAKDGQTTAQETKQKTKLKYDCVKLCQDCGSTAHGTAYFVGGEMYDLNNFGDIASACWLMDDESAKKFRNDVALFQDRGMFENLLSTEAKAKKEEQRRQAKQRRDAKRQKLLGRLKNLEGWAASVKARELNNLALAKTVTDYLEDALSQARLEETVLREMSERYMEIRISVMISGNREVVDLTINPHDLICKDVNDLRTDVEKKLAEIMSELQDVL